MHACVFICTCRAYVCAHVYVHECLCARAYAQRVPVCPCVLAERACVPVCVCSACLCSCVYAQSVPVCPCVRAERACVPCVCAACACAQKVTCGLAEGLAKHACPGTHSQRSGFSKCGLRLRICFVNRLLE